MFLFNINLSLKKLLYIPIADIVFVVEDKPHPLLKREGNDLTSKPEISLVTVRTTQLS